MPHFGVSGYPNLYLDACCYLVSSPDHWILFFYYCAATELISILFQEAFELYEKSYGMFLI